MTPKDIIGNKPVGYQILSHLEFEQYFPMRRNTSILVVFSIAVICLLRFAFFYDTYRDNPNLIIDPDTKSYLDISSNLYQHSKYNRVLGIPEIHRPPGYPLFLTINYALFGQDNLLAPVIMHHILFFFMLLCLTSAPMAPVSRI